MKFNAMTHTVFPEMEERSASPIVHPFSVFTVFSLKVSKSEVLLEVPNLTSIEPDTDVL